MKDGIKAFLYINYDIFFLQRIRKRKAKKQIEIDKAAYEAEQMEDNQNGSAGFPMVGFICR